MKMELERSKIKTLIEVSDSAELANEVIETYCGFETIKEKIAFLLGMFDVEIIDQKEKDLDEDIYSLLLNSIVSQKFR